MHSEFTIISETVYGKGWYGPQRTIDKCKCQKCGKENAVMETDSEGVTRVSFKNDATFTTGAHLRKCGFCGEEQTFPLEKATFQGYTLQSDEPAIV